ncbi:signal recognition particle protein [Psittacicella melopsittaci]|uniref:Signal recognition particle protein n=1 Tax=Psittacicella melopsittaci TaxID=2028576 RepID=A0A3A1Y3N3_9GAMM|nr:signal recognition particle protein [Psittacicella melopsittaci]RIY32175.1 signal recognition particle protein [Psittacicella melopsittaci]
MFDNLTNRLQQAFKSLTGKSTLSEDNIADALSEVRRALIEADVALPVVRSFLDQVKSEAIGTQVNPRLNPEQAFIDIIHKSLIKAMGEKNEALDLRTQPPAVVLMAGLQGAGKTTSVAKLAKFLKQQKKKVLVVSADVYRPAAIQQLETLAQSVEVDFFPSEVGQNPVEIATNALQQAKRGYYDVLIVDTAGRLHVDQTMMDEIKAIHAAIKPIETLFTVDAMTGQDAANTAKAFNEALPLTGVILTKLDGDVRGGAALSIRQITGKPIKFLGVGEKTDALEAFHPDRIANRILDMGDMLTYIDKLQNEVSEEQLKRTNKILKNKKEFDLEDFLEQTALMEKMGGSDSLFSALPGGKALQSQLAGKIDNETIAKKTRISRAIIQSMTPEERRNPKIIKHSRKLRIAKGCGQPVQEINQLLTQFEQMKKLQSMFSSGALSGLLKAMGGGGLSGLANMFGRGRKPF